MDELFVFLVVLAIVLGVVTVVGHLIWLLVAWAFRAIFGLPPAAKSKEAQEHRCVFCDRQTPQREPRCQWCGRELESRAAKDLADLSAVERSMRRWNMNDKLPASVVEAVLDRARDERRELKGLPPVEKPKEPLAEEEIVTAMLVDEPATGQTPTVPKAPTRPEEREVRVPSKPVPPPEAKPAPPPKPAPSPPKLPPAPAPGRPRPAAPPERPARPPSPVAAPKREPAPAPAARPMPRPKPAAPPAPAAPPPPPRKSWLEMLTGFMEERNIRWAELIAVLVGGMLIVGPSIALVISFWETLQERPYLKFAVFVAYSAVIFGSGLYAHYRWKLQYTSRGLLVIATLLVPLNFLAMASMSADQASGLAVACEVASLAIFLALVYLAGRALVPEGRWEMPLAVVGSAAAILLFGHWPSAAAQPGSLVAFGLLPVGLFAAGLGSYVLRRPGREGLQPRQADALFILTGTAAFAIAVALGLLVSQGAKAAGLGATLDAGSLLVALAALPLLASGLTVSTGVGRERELGGYRTAGTAVGLLGTGLMLAALGLAWPVPGWLLVVGTLNAAALVLVAFRYRLPIAHAGAIASAAVVYLLGYHLLAGHLSLAGGQTGQLEMVKLAVGAPSAAALVGFFVLLAAAAELLARRGRRDHALQYAGGAGVVAVVSLLSVTVHAFRTAGEQAPLAAVVFGLYGAGALALNARFREKVASYAGLGLLVGATLWTCWWVQPDHVGPYWATVLAAEAAVFAAAAIGLGRLSGRKAHVPWSAPSAESELAKLVDLYRVPLLHAAEAVAALALALGGFTAWADRAAIHHVPAPALTAALVAAVCLAMAWGYRSMERTWTGSMIVLAGLVHTLTLNYTGLLPIKLPLLDACLAHATLAVAASIGLDWAARRGPLVGLGRDVRRVFARPLGDTGLVSTAAALPVLLVSPWDSMVSLSVCLFWLAAIWGVVSWTHRRPALFALSQTAVTAAVLAGTTAWLERSPFAPARPIDLLDPWCVQSYGVALGLLTLVWLGVRMGTRKVSLARRLLDPGWPPVDRVVAHVLPVVALAMVAFGSLVGVGRELVGGFPNSAVLALDTPGWLFAAVLGGGLIAALWHRWGMAELVGALLVVASVPCLVANRFDASLAVASALRWSMGFTFLLVAAAVWYRRPLAEAARSIGARPEPGPLGPRVARALLLATTAAPVVLLTLWIALGQLAGAKLAGPVAETFFDRIGMSASYVVPLLLVTLGLVGFALRESSAGYAFAAGLVVEMIVGFGYLLGLDRLDVAEVVMLLQLLTITAAVWAIAWLAMRKWTAAWRQAPDRPAARVLMNVQLAFGALGNGLLLVPALLAIVSLPHRWHDWAEAAGTWVGWAALILAAGAAVYRGVQQGRRLQPGMAGLMGMTVLGLLACTVRLMVPESPDWGYRTLMLGWACYALFTVLATWWVAGQRTLPGAQGPPQALVRAASIWTTAAGLAAVLLGLKIAFFHAPSENLLWAAAAIATASAAGAAMAVWRRREGWAFAAAPGVNVAASLVVWYFQRELAFETWWIHLVQANVIASAAVTLVWLAARRRLYELRDLSVRTSPMLGIQTALAPTACLVILIQPVMRMLVMPASLPDWAASLASPPGWIGLVLAAAAAGWYLRQVSPRDLFHVLGGAAIAVGVMACCFTARYNDLLPQTEWLSFHVLTVAWTAAAVLVLGGGWLGRNLRLAGQLDPEAPSSGWPRETIFRPAVVEAWTVAVGLAALVVAVLWSYEDPLRPWWSAGPVLALVALAGVLGLWRRRWAYAYASAVLLNVAGTLVWMVHGPSDLVGLVAANVICLAAASVGWSAIGFCYRPGVPAPEAGETRLPVSHVAAQVGLCLWGTLVAMLVIVDLMDGTRPPVGQLGWIALGSIAGAVALSLWDRTARFPLPGLYLTGLVAAGMGWLARSLEPAGLCWTAGPELAAFALGAAVLAWVLPRLAPAAESIGMGDLAVRTPREWFPACQAAVAAVAVGLSVWVSIDFRFDSMAFAGLEPLWGRTAGPVTAALLAVAAVLVAGRSRDRWRTVWQDGAIALACLLLAELGWALLAAETPLPWLHRSVVLMVAAVAATLLTGFALPSLLPAASDWVVRARRMVTALGGLAGVMLVLVLLQEAAWFSYSADGTPMATWAVVVVAGALAALLAGCLGFAVVPAWDPMGLSDRGRQGYVYAAEALGGLIGAHLWLTRPDLFRLGIVEHYWMLMVVGGAFAGAAVAEVFHRRGMAVVSEPLRRTAVFLPLVPAVAFLIPTEAAAALPLAGKSPAVWFLTATFYGFLATTRRSPGFGVLSLGSGVAGLWVFWQDQGWGFLQHPQLWLIPVGLAVLVAEHLNRDRLTGTQTTASRYLALGLIYVSSSTEYLWTLGESLWLPLVLVGLSVAGVLVGIVLRIRSFLSLGIVFLGLVLVTMIKYAALDLDQVWVFWVSCIALGLGIIGMFMVFEKRRDDILAAVKRFRQWER